MENKTKVLLVAPTPPPYGGIANWTLLIKKNIKKHPEVELLGSVNIAPRIAVLEGRNLGDRVVGQGVEMFKLNKTLKERIRKEKPDVIHITTSGQLAIIRDILFLKNAKKAKVPTVYHIRFGRIPEIAEANTLEWKLMRRAVRLASTTMAIDENTYKALKKYCRKASICKVPNPFDISAIEGIVETGHSSETRKIMFLGWCVKTKGIEELFAAWEAIHEHYPGWMLEIVGPAEEVYLKSLKEKYSMQQVLLLGEKNHN
ncbi:MAG: glycosyltransferase, partial [Anaerobutyricum soehngenii]